MILTIIILSLIIIVAIFAILILAGRICKLYDIIDSQRITVEFWRNEYESNTSTKA